MPNAEYWGIDRMSERLLPALMVGLLLGGVQALAGQSESAGRPLPDIGQLLLDVHKNQKAIDKLVDQYSCMRLEENHLVDKDGRVKKTMLREYEVFYLGGTEVTRLVRKDGNALSAGDQKKEDERVEKRVRKYLKTHDAGDDDDTQEGKKRDRADISTFLRVSNFNHARREDFRGHAVIVFDFEPNPACKPQTRAEDFLHKLIGTLWVDEEAHQVVRLEAHLGDAFKFGGGVFASIRKGSSMVFEQARINDEVWLPSYAEMHFSARVLLFANANGDFNVSFKEYKKFHVESVIRGVAAP
jgi:hypothetical protein